MSAGGELVLDVVGVEQRQQRVGLRVEIAGGACGLQQHPDMACATRSPGRCAGSGSRLAADSSAWWVWANGCAPAERHQPLQRRGGGAQRRRAEQERLLAGPLVLVEKHHHQAGPAAESAEHRALADAGGRARSSMVTASAPCSAISRRAASSRSCAIACRITASAGRRPTVRQLGSAHAHTDFNSAGINRTTVRLWSCEDRTWTFERDLDMTDILVLVGSLRAASMNRQIADVAAEVAAAEGIGVTSVRGSGRRALLQRGHGRR